MPPADPSRRARVLAAAVDLFTRYGLRRTSIDDIAEAAAVAKGSVYLEFASKSDVFRAAAQVVVDEVLAAARNAAAAPGTVETRLVAVLLAKFWRFYELIHSRPHAHELIQAKAADAADVFRVADDQYAQIVEAVLAAERWTISAHELAGVVLRAAHGTGYGSAKLTASAYRKRLMLSVRLALAGARRK